MPLFRRKAKTDAEVLKEQEKKEKTPWHKRPANTAFKQQRLKAWQPILTPATVLPTFFLVGIIFVPLGGVLLWGSNKVKEFTLDYTNCANDAGTDSFEEMPSSQWSYSVDSSSTIQAPAWQYSQDTSAPVGQRDLCRITFDLPVELSKPVFMYYKLTNYYQNHRRYVMSVDSAQLHGDDVSYKTIDGGDCKPVDVRENRIVYPCGLVANSLFNDTFTQPILLNAAGSSSGNVTYNMTDRGIAWPGEHEKYKRTKYSASQIIPPPYWAERYPDGYTDDNIPDLTQDEHFQVWMRTAGLPTFRKLYYRNDDEDMPSGRYEIDIYMNYPVRPFGGTKSIVFSTVSFIGGKNPFLGIAYIAVGGVCVLLGLLLTLRHLIKPRKLGDPQYLSWNRAPAH
ncbi:CDC50/LEM3 family protein [Rhodotorula paludigena]|uniref:CDC50/LEM3 family protein n=1 Tax=Rhodotorula paludigena TaxID=86838 RepID=UPI00316F3DF4